MAETKKLCSICDQRHISQPSHDWCPECDQALCEECKVFHSLSKLLKHHVTIPIGEYQSSVSSIPATGNFCPDHDEKYQLYCQRHDRPLCHQCMEQHSVCTGVIPLSQMTKNIKASTTFIETEISLGDLIGNVALIERSLEENLQILETQKRDIFSIVEKIRSSVNKHLDMIQERLVDEVSELTEKASTEIKTDINNIRDRKTEISGLKQQVEHMRAYATDLQAFIGLRHIVPKIETSENVMQSMLDDGRMDKRSLKLNICETLENMAKSVKSFGSIRLQRDPSDVKLVKQKDKQAQLVGTKPKSIDDIKVNLIQTIDTKASFVWGCCRLSDGNFVIGRNIYRSCLSGEYSLSILTESPLFDVAFIDDRTVATTAGLGSSGINIIDIKSLQVTKSFATDDCCFGITYTNGSLVYCVMRKGVKKVDVKLGKSTLIVRCQLPSPCYVTSSNNKLYYNHWDSKSVTCCDIEGTTIWTYKDVQNLSRPYGIAVDNNGRVYVADNQGHSVVVLSDDGTCCRHLITQRLGLESPTALHFDRVKNQLLVVTRREKTFLFDVS